MQQGLLVYALLGAVLLTAAAWDWRTHQVPNWLTYAGMAAGVVLAAVLGPWDTVNLPHSRPGCAGVALVSMVVGLLPMWVVFYLGGMGGGDVKLMGAVGAILARPEAVIYALAYSFLAAVILAIAIMIRHRLVLRTLRRIVAAMLGRQTLPDDSPRVPFAVAILIGGMLAGWQLVLQGSLR
jgi:prepilin peptidase CpaA